MDEITHAVHVSRRAVVRTVAWTTPVVAVAAAVPAFATSLVNDISDPVFTVSTTSSRVLVDSISVTNDGPSTLAARTVRLTITSLTEVLVPVLTTGSWVPDPAGAGFGDVSFLYDAPVPVGESVPLTGFVLAQRERPVAGIFNVTVSYIGPV